MHVLVQHLGNCALAVTIAGAYVAETHVPVQEYLRQLQTQKPALLSKSLKHVRDLYKKGVIAVWGLFFEATSRRPAFTAGLPPLIGRLSHEEIFAGLFHLDHEDSSFELFVSASTPSVNNGNYSSLANKLTIGEALAMLQDYSFLTWDDDCSS